MRSDACQRDSEHCNHTATQLSYVTTRASPANIISSMQGLTTHFSLFVPDPLSNTSITSPCVAALSP